jgi:3-oxoacyl-[acyl-carrier protein] reductase
MDLKINDNLFIVTGASSGLGNAVARTLLENAASLIVVARRDMELKSLHAAYPDQIEIVCGDVLNEDTIDAIVNQLGDRKLSGVFVNAGGPPAMSFGETEMQDWDHAYRLLLSWKVLLIKKILPSMKKHAYGRILFSESVSIKQPIENLVLSNSLRMAVAGMAKTLALEVASQGITVNIIGPGYHETAAVDRLFKKTSELENISVDTARDKTIEQIPTGTIGKPEDFASLSAWLLSPLSGFVTGQVIAIDGGTVRYSLG